MYDILSRSVIFQGMGEEEIESALEKIVYQFRSFEKGRLVAQRGESCTQLMLLLEGSVRGEMLDLSGNVMKIEDISAPRPLAVAFVFGKDNVYPVNITANERVRILSFPKASLISLFRSEPRVLENFLNAVSGRAQFLGSRLHILSFKTLRKKLAYFLVQQSGGRNRFRMSVTQRELAEYLGVERPSLARTLAELKDLGLIWTEGKMVEIIDREGLQITGQ